MMPGKQINHPNMALYATDTPISLRAALRALAAERNWDQFHSPNNLAIALSVEPAELLERSEWMTDADSAALSSAQKGKGADELADVLLYLVRLPDKVDVDLLEAARAKLALNADKYPIERSRGSSNKYTEL